MKKDSSRNDKINWKIVFWISLVVLIVLWQFLYLPTFSFTNVPNETHAIETKINEITSSVPELLVITKDIEKFEPKKEEAKKEKPLAPIIIKKPTLVSNNPIIQPETKTLLSNTVKSKDSVHGGNLQHQSISWKDFVNLNYNEHFYDSKPNKVKLTSKPINICPNEIVHALAKPRLSDEEFKWCRWALSPSGGKVVVGKSWGDLKSKESKEKFDALNCNSVNEGKNPSCDDSWGDIHIRHWQKNVIDELKCHQDKSSNVQCYKNDNNDMYCLLKNAQINFSKMKKVSRGGGMTPSKKFENDFLSADCKSNVQVENKFPFPHLYSPQLSTQQCDVIYNGTLLMYSHDDIRNLGHTLNDVFNVWIMLWMEGIARYGHDIEMLNIDSFKLGHNFDDQPNHFFLTYQKSLRNILKGIDFHSQTLCAKKLLIQPIPPRFFIWESWFVDLPCSFLGPSSLYQRWNLHVRNDYQLVNIDRSHKNFKWKLLLVVRNEHSNMWGTQRTSRNYLNTEDIQNGIQTFLTSHQQEFQDFELLAIDLGKLSFEEQLQLIGQSSIMIGMHGAGMASSMHMSIGEKNCCGVLEMFPKGEFSPIKGHGNMVRKMGIYYDRLDIGGEDSHGNGATVPIPPLIDKLKNMLRNILKTPTCVLPEVIEDPYLEN
jgi:hypothetical protein